MQITVFEFKKVTGRSPPSSFGTSTEKLKLQITVFEFKRVTGRSPSPSFGTSTKNLKS
jgi:hypothetical protein